MNPAARKLLLTAHILASVGWIGGVLAYIPFDLATARSTDPQVARAAYATMDVIAREVLLPLALAALATGILISLLTPWGLFRHWWVVLSLILTTVATLVLVVELRTIGHLADLAADPTMSDADLIALPSTLPHSIGGLTVLLATLALNVYKPRGLTRYGWRKQREENAAARSPP